MRKRRGAGRLAACLLAAVMVFALMVPTSVSAATTTYTKKASAFTISKGQSYHIMNTDIGTNKITSYTITITPKNSKTRYDVAAAASYTSDDGTAQPTETLLRCMNKKVQITNSAGTFVKSSTSSNTGMLACITVRKGSVTVQVTCKSKNSGTIKLRRFLQASNHETLKSVKVKKGGAIRFTMNSGNLSGTPLILGAKSGYVAIRALSSTAYEKYTFGASKLLYNIYSNGSLYKSSQMSYSSTYSSLRYSLLRTKQRNSGWLTTSAGRITYFYPSDYVNMTYETRTISN